MDRMHQFAAVGAGADVLFLKVHGDTHSLQFLHRLQQGHCIPGHPGNGLGRGVVDGCTSCDFL